MTSIGIIGAGISGISVARLIQRFHAHIACTIYTQDDPLQTHSDAAGARWYAPRSGLLRDCAIESLPYLQELSRDTSSGVCWQWCRYGTKSHDDFDRYTASIPREILFRRVQPSPTEIDLGLLWAGKIALSVFDVPRYRAYLLKAYQDAGGRIQRETVGDIAPYSAQHDALILCVGIGALKLVGDDQSISPVRGYTYIYPHCAATSFSVPYQDLYAIQRNPTTRVLGVLNDEPACDVQERAHEQTQLTARAEQYGISVPDSGSALIGIRCRRKLGLRIERAEMHGIPVIYNYGYASSGYGASWGGAARVLKLLGLHVVLQP